MSKHELTELELSILAFERQWWRHAGAKESAIKETFGLAPAAYYQLLSVLIDSEGAHEAEPMLIKRLRRLRDARSAKRADGFKLG
jgi:hypothetical protein